MSLAPGTRLGPYRVLAPIGAGGMGEVYRAHDERLGRDVAVKVLPAEVADDPEALARFEREARAVAQLSHPGILAIHDWGREGETAYAVMELLEGETLRARLASGPLPARKAVELATQIADALAAAHDKGVVHRDLKPENVFVTREGRAKLLDFGLAKLAVSAGGPYAAMPTASVRTGPGVVMGTVGYMSPEQVRGEPVDRRSDLFSFGAVLYEMLTGRRAFVRETAAESLTAILKEDPPEIAAGASGPSPAVSRIVQHCLEKRAEERFESARDVAFALQAVAASAAGGPAAGAVGRTAGRPALVALGLIVALGVAAAGSYRAGQGAERRRAAAVRFRQMTFRPQPIFQAAFAPDGETIVYSAALEGNVPQLFTIRPEYPEPQALGLPRTHLLSISARGELAVLTNARLVAQRLFTGTLARLPLGGAAPREILEGVRQADWSPDGTELAIIRIADGKDRLEYPIGKVLYETAGYLSDLRVSPGGDRIAVFEHPAKWDDRGSVAVVDRTGARAVLSGDYWGEEGLAWSRAGDEVLFSASTAGAIQALYAVDLARHLRVVLRSAGSVTMHDVSRTGRFLVTRDDRRNQVSVLAPGMKAERDVSWLDYSVWPSLSRDGALLLFSEQSASAGPNYAVCLRRSDGGPVTRLGDGRPFGLSPDGKWALAAISSPLQLVLYPTGPGEPRRLPHGELEGCQSGGWFPDGKRILLCGNPPGRASRCYAQDVSGEAPPVPITPDGTADGIVSPDGRQVAYSSSAGTWFTQRTDGGTARAVPGGLPPDARVIGWDDGGSALYVYLPKTVPFRFERLDLASGRRELIREVAPTDRAGVVDSAGAGLTSDAASYAYDYARMTSQLFVVDGAR